MPNAGEPEQSSEVKTTPWVFVWLAIATVGIGLLFVAWNYYQITSSLTAVGTVVSVEEHYSKRSGSAGITVYKPKFSFIDANGVSHYRKVRANSSELGYEVGTKLRIAYSLENPAYVSIVDWSHSMGIPKVCFMVAGFWLVLFAVTRKQAADAAAAKQKVA